MALLVLIPLSAFLVILQTAVLPSFVTSSSRTPPSAASARTPARSSQTGVSTRWDWPASIVIRQGPCAPHAGHNANTIAGRNTNRTAAPMNLIICSHLRIY